MIRGRETQSQRGSAGIRERTFWERARQIAQQQPTGTVGAAIILTILVLSLLAPALNTVDPFELNVTNRLAAPSGESWFGTDHIGRDVYSRAVYGGRISLLVGFSVAVFSLTVGAALGLIAGYNRQLDSVIMRVMDGIMAIPGILLAIALVAVLGASVPNVIIALGIVDTPGATRVARSTVLSLRDQPFVDSARSIGASPRRILFMHIFPNIVSPLVVMGTFICAAAILSEAYLSFIGAGTPPATPSWGNIMAESRDFIHQAIWTIFFPGLILAVFVTSMNVVGDSMRDILDPKLAHHI